MQYNPALSDHHNSLKVANLEESLERMGGDRVLLKELAVFYIRDTPALFEELQRGIDNHLPSDVKIAAHSLKGLSSNFGASFAYDAALRIEVLSEDEDSDALTPLIANLRQRVDELVHWMRSEFDL